MSFMDRVFFSASAQDPHPFRFKPAAAVVSARRSGTTSTLDQLNKYFFHQQMPIATSRYWNMVHGNTPEEVKQAYPFLRRKHSGSPQTSYDNSFPAVL